MIRPERVLQQRGRALVERLRFGEISLRAVELTEVVRATATADAPPPCA